MQCPSDSPITSTSQKAVGDTMSQMCVNSASENELEEPIKQASIVIEWKYPRPVLDRGIICCGRKGTKHSKEQDVTRSTSPSEGSKVELQTDVLGCEAEGVKTDDCFLDRSSSSLLRTFSRVECLGGNM